MGLISNSNALTRFGLGATLGPVLGGVFTDLVVHVLFSLFYDKTNLNRTGDGAFISTFRSVMPPSLLLLFSSALRGSRPSIN